MFIMEILPTCKKHTIIHPNTSYIIRVKCQESGYNYLTQIWVCFPHQSTLFPSSQASVDWQIGWPEYTPGPKEKTAMNNGPFWRYGCQPKNKGTPKSSVLIGFSIIFTIHFGGFPYSWKHPYVSYLKDHLSDFQPSKTNLSLFSWQLPSESLIIWWIVAVAPHPFHFRPCCDHLLHARIFSCLTQNQRDLKSGGRKNNKK